MTRQKKVETADPTEGLQVSENNERSVTPRRGYDGPLTITELKEEYRCQATILY